MSVSLPNKSIFSIASTMSAALDMTAISNAAEAVATLEASHGVIANDILILESGWTLLDGRIARAGAVNVNDVTLEDIDTSDLGNYPALSGVGSVRRVTAWTQIAQVMDNEVSGGDPQFASYSFIEDPTERQIPIGKTGKNLTLMMADDPTKAWYSVAKAADAEQKPRPIRVQLPGGGVIYYNGYISFDDEPSLKKNEIMQVKLTVSLVAKSTRY